MSWSVHSTGKVPDVRKQISESISRFTFSDPGEQETVKLVGGLIDQTLSTFGPDRLVSVQASGSMGYHDYSTKSDPFQQFTINVNPINLTT